MNLTEFVKATAKAINDSHHLVLADDDPDDDPRNDVVHIAWGVGSEPDTIIVRTSDGTFSIKVERL